MSRARIFDNYPEKLQSASLEELEEWLEFFKKKSNEVSGLALKGIRKEIILVEKLIARKRNEIL